MTKNLIEYPGTDVNATNDNSMNCLFFAVINNNEECVKLLRQDPRLQWNQRDCSGQTAALIAARMGCAEILTIFLSNPTPQIDLRIIDEVGYNLAWRALEGRADWNCIRLLCSDPRVDWNQRHPSQSSSGMTPLLWCLARGRLEEAMILIRTPTVDLDIHTNRLEYPETIAR